jgi:hypothetical protein
LKEEELKQQLLQQEQEAIRQQQMALQKQVTHHSFIHTQSKHI